MDKYAVAGLPRPEHRRRPAARLHPEPGRDRARHRHQPARAPDETIACRPRSPTSPTSTRTTSRSRATTAGGCSPSATGLWHSDSSFKVDAGEVLAAARASASRRRAATPQFAYMRARLRCARTRRRKDEVEDLVCEHSQMYSRQLIGFTDFTRRGARALQAGAPAHGAHSSGDRRASRSTLSSHAGGIVGWPVPEARGYLRDLIEHATQREFVYAHKWRVGDLVMWDNRQTMHRARPFPARRAARHAPHDLGGRRADGGTDDDLAFRRATGRGGCPAALGPISTRSGSPRHACHGRSPAGRPTVRRSAAEWRQT